MEKRKPQVRVQQFDPGTFVIKANSEMFITNRQDWIFRWLETKEESLKKAEKHLQELVNLQARRCPTWHRVLAGMFVYYPLFKWRRAFVAWFWKTLIVPFLLFITFPLRWSFKRLVRWMEDNGDLVRKAISWIPKMFKYLLIASVLLGFWIAVDYGYQKDVADGAKSVVTAVVIEAPLKTKASVVEWYSEQVRKQTEAEVHEQQERLAVQKYQKWQEENPTEAAKAMEDLERMRLEQAEIERQEIERKWQRRALWWLGALKIIGIFIIAIIVIFFVVGAVISLLCLLAETIKPFQRFLRFLYRAMLTLVALFFIGFEKYTPTFYRGADFIVVEIPILHRKGVYVWDWVWGKLCPALSVQGTQDMLQDVQSQLVQLRADQRAQKAAAETIMAPPPSSPNE